MDDLDDVRSTLLSDFARHVLPVLEVLDRFGGLIVAAKQPSKIFCNPPPAASMTLSESWTAAESQTLST
ncbi:MAG: hypothetical protein AAGJ94_02035 [Pseudomonadota bacterium]